jgi:hypothetical protein
MAAIGLTIPDGSGALDDYNLTGGASGYCFGRSIRGVPQHGWLRSAGSLQHSIGRLSEQTLSFSDEGMLQCQLPAHAGPVSVVDGVSRPAMCTCAGDQSCVLSGWLVRSSDP